MSKATRLTRSIKSVLESNYSFDVRADLSEECTIRLSKEKFGSEQYDKLLCLAHLLDYETRPEIELSDNDLAIFDIDQALNHIYDIKKEFKNNTEDYAYDSVTSIDYRFDFEFNGQYYKHIRFFIRIH